MTNPPAINTNWFKGQLADRRMPQRRLAKMMNLDPSAVSLMFRGKRAIALEECADLARILGVPLADVLANAGVDLPQEVDSEHHVPIDGWIDPTGLVHPQKPPGPKTAARPPGAPEGTVALRIMTDDFTDGWLVYFRPVEYIMPEAIGRMAIVELSTGAKVLRVMRHGYAPGAYRLTHPHTGFTENNRIASASMVTWAKQ